MKKGDLVRHNPTGIRGLLMSVSERNGMGLLFYHHGKFLNVKLDELKKIK